MLHIMQKKKTYKSSANTVQEHQIFLMLNVYFYPISILKKL